MTNKRTIKNIVSFLILHKILILTWVFLSFTFIPAFAGSSFGPYRYPELSTWLSVWANSDGVNYLEIVEKGYHYPLFAFFPLFPLLLAGLGQIFGNIIVAGIILNNLALGVGLFFLYKIARLDFSESVAKRAVIWVLIYPLAFFYQALYADAIYFCLSTISFYQARQQLWFKASFFGLLAASSRLVGLVMIPAFITEWYLTKKIKKIDSASLKKFFQDHVFWVFMIGLGVSLYGGYLQMVYGDFFLFKKAMADWHQALLVFPLQTIFRYLKIFLTIHPNVPYFIAITEFLCTFGYFALSVYVWVKIRKSYGVMMIFTLLMPSLTGTFQSIPRYILHLFPAFIAFAVLSEGISKRSFYLLVGLMLFLQAIFTALFVQGYFVA